jgi:hypothetical protein
MVLIAALGVSTYWLGSVVKRGVESVGSHVAKTDVKLDGATLLLVTGAGTLSGLVVSNPQGFKAESAMTVGSISIAVAPATVFADKVWVREVSVLAPEITFEKGLGASNLARLLDNVQTATGGSRPSRKLQVDDLLISDGQITFGTAMVPLPQIHLTNLGNGPEGITAEELTSKVLTEILQEAIKALAK